MAQKVTIQVVDDIDGSEASETLSFGLDGTTYEVDLNDKNSKALRKALAPYLEVARKVGRSNTARARKASAAATGASAAEIREWANSNGLDVPTRGRIPAEVREAFDAR